MLLWVVYGLVGTIGLMVFAVFLRETWRAWERRRFERLKIDCTRRLRVLKYLEPEDLAARLRASFSLPVIEKCLEEFAEESATSRHCRCANFVRYRAGGVFFIVGTDTRSACSVSAPPTCSSCGNDCRTT